MSTNKSVLLGMLAFAVAVPLSVTAVVGGPSATETDAAIRATLDNYLAGVDKQDMALLEKAFAADHAHMKYVVKAESGGETVKIVPIREAFANWTKPPAKPCKGRVINLDVADGRMASAKYEFIWGDVTFIDFLTLYKIDGEWKIVNKTFVRQE